MSSLLSKDQAGPANAENDLKDVPLLEKGVIIVKDNKYFLSYKDSVYYLCVANAINNYYLDYLANERIASIDREERLGQWK